MAGFAAEFRAKGEWPERPVENRGIKYPVRRTSGDLSFERPTREGALGLSVAPRVPLLARPRHLVIANGSDETSGALLSVAARLAERAGASVHLVLLHDPPPPGEIGNVARLSALHHGGTSASCERLFRAARTLADTTGLPVTPEFLVGPLRSTLTEYVRKNEFDLVIAPARGGWSSAFGGEAWAAAARRRSVLLVGPKVRPDWADETQPTPDVLIPLDGSASAEEAVGPAIALGRLLHARLTLLRAGVPNTPSDREAMEYLTHIARLIRRHVPVRVVTTATRPTAAVLDYQRATGAVVSLAARAGSRLRSYFPDRLTARLLRQSTSPILVRL